MKYKFQLSGLGDTMLENSVHEAVKHTNYSGKELSDIREPVQYSLFDHIKQKSLQLQQTAALTTDIVIPDSSITNIKTLLKRIFAKIFRGYVVPMTASQSCFNRETSVLISELVFLLEIQRKAVEQMQKELYELREKRV